MMITSSRSQCDNGWASSKLLLTSLTDDWASGRLLPRGCATEALERAEQRRHLTVTSKSKPLSEPITRTVLTELEENTRFRLILDAASTAMFQQLSLPDHHEKLSSLSCLPFPVIEWDDDYDDVASSMSLLAHHEEKNHDERPEQTIVGAHQNEQNASVSSFSLRPLLRPNTAAEAAFDEVVVVNKSTTTLKKQQPCRLRRSLAFQDHLSSMASKPSTTDNASIDVSRNSSKDAVLLSTYGKHTLKKKQQPQHICTTASLTQSLASLAVTNY